MLVSPATSPNSSTGVWLAPNTQQFTRYIGPEHEVVLDVHETKQAHAPRRRPSPAGAVTAVLLLVACLMSMSRVSEFLDFQF